MRGLQGAIAALLLLFLEPAIARLPETPRFEVIDIRDGLPSNFVRALAQDRDGNLWVATRDGLARFDGVKFQTYRFEPGDNRALPSNSVSALHVDRAGTLWIGTQGKGLVHYEPGVDGFIRELDGALADLDLQVTTIASTPGGSLWVGTWADGVFHREANGDWTRYHTKGAPGFSIPSNEATKIETDSEGTVWLGGEAGLLRWTTKGFERVPVGDLGFSRVTVLSSDAEGLWVGTIDGLRVRSRDGSFHALNWRGQPPVRTTSALRLDREGTRWLATSFGIHVVRDGVATPVVIPGSSPAPGADMLEDSEGGFWVARNGAGLLRQLPNWRRFAQFPFGRGEHSVSATLVTGISRSTDNDFWVVGTLGGLDKFDAGHGTVKRVLSAESLAGCKPISVLETRLGGLWVGCHDRLLKIHLKGERFESWTETSVDHPILPGPVFNLYEDDRDRLWVLSFGGLQLRGEDGSVIVSLDNDASLFEEFNTLQVSPGGQAWMATDHGLYRWVEAQQAFRYVQGSGRDEIIRLAFQDETHIWTHSIGKLAAFELIDGRLHLLREFSVGVPAVASTGMVVSGSEVLLMTPRGLLRLEIASGRAGLLGLSDGLPDPEFVPFPPSIARNGVVATSTPSGLVVFDPKDLIAPNSSPVATFEEITLRRNDRSVQVPAVAAHVTLESGDRDLRVTARIRSLVDPANRHYRFWLRGYDRNWIDDPEGERVFTRLDPGTYRLEMMASISDGVWSKPQQLTVVVLPPWWQTTQARIAFALAAVLFVLACAAAFRARVRRIHAAKLLEERRALAEQASAAKSRFLADLGHEIRTPMTGVLGMAELLHSEMHDPKQLGRVEAIQAAGQHLLRLLNDALDLARIEAGRLELQDVPFDLRQLLADVSALLRPQAESKELAFELRLAETLPKGVRGDAGRLRQVLLNLGHNAVKFTDTGRVVVGADWVDGCVQVTVTDTGVGLDTALQARLFGRFEQAVGAHSTSIHGGSGLGLSICRELIHAMGGTIVVESTPDCGACFTVSLPLPVVELQERRTAPRLQVRDTGAARILLVEDDALVAQVVGEMLARQGHDVEIAAHGLEALARAASSHFDLVFLDLDLPGLDGLELARMWPQQGLSVPLVALTARADAEAEPHARAAGMVGFLRKPVTGDMLGDAVARHASAQARSEDVETVAAE